MGVRSALMIAALLALAGCGGGEKSEENAATGPALKTVQISEVDFKLEPANVTVEKAGVYSFKVVNNGQTAHALEIEGEGVEAKSDTIQPGASTELKVDLKQAGSYEMYCPVDGHKDRGMKGEVSVGPGGGTMTDQTETKTTSSGY